MTTWITLDGQGRAPSRLGASKARALSDAVSQARLASREALEGLMLMHGDVEVGTLVAAGTPMARLMASVSRDGVLSRWYAALVLLMAVVVGGATLVTASVEIVSQSGMAMTEAAWSLVVGLAIVAFLGWIAFTVTLARSDRTALGRIPHLAAAAGERLTLGRDRVYHARPVHDSRRHYDVRDALEVSEFPYAMIGSAYLQGEDLVISDRDGGQLVRLRGAAEATSEMGKGIAPGAAIDHISHRTR